MPDFPQAAAALCVMFSRSRIAAPCRLRRHPLPSSRPDRRHEGESATRDEQACQPMLSCSDAQHTHDSMFQCPVRFGAALHASRLNVNDERRLIVAKQRRTWVLLIHEG
jgi:hypothetical protein